MATLFDNEPGAWWRHRVQGGNQGYGRQNESYQKQPNTPGSVIQVELELGVDVHYVKAQFTTADDGVP